MSDGDGRDGWDSHVVGELVEWVVVIYTVSGCNNGKYGQKRE